MVSRWAESVQAFQQVNEQVEGDIIKAEAIALPLLFVLSLLVFRGGRRAAAAVRRHHDGRRHLLALRIVNEFSPSRSSRSTWSSGSGSASPSTTACSSSRATGRSSPATGRGPSR